MLDTLIMDRRRFLPALAASVTARAADPAAILIDPKPVFEVSPYFYMQFMEPLGSTDSSVEAAWDYDIDNWRTDFIDTVRDLAPDVIRFGGLFSRYYKWREGIGPVAKRPWMRNYVWGGKETNRVGTHEFVDFCRRVGAEPMYCVNFLSDGESRYHNTPEGNRTGDAQEAADWVSFARPYNIKLWQLGNETSYGNRTFTKDESIAHTIEFARAMKQRDPSIQLIGWGDRDRNSEIWAPDLLKRAGEHLDYVAIHMMGQSPRRPDTVLKGNLYQRDPEKAWHELVELSDRVEARVTELEQAISSVNSHVGIAITEGHLSLSPHNTNPVLREWLSAVYHARSLNIYLRHGDRVKIATAADFAGNRWTVNAVMLATPGRNSYLMPVGSVSRLFKRHTGSHGVRVRSTPSGLDIAATRRANTILLHVANLEYSRAVEAAFAIDGLTVRSGTVHAIAPAGVRESVDQDQPGVFRPVESKLPPSGRWTFPPASVSAVELDCSIA